MKQFILGIGISALIATGAMAGGEIGQAQRIKELATGVQLTQSCPSGTNVCAAGALGPGGCYQPGYTRCWQGMVCRSHERICSQDQSPNAPVPYCYDPSLPNTCVN